MQAIVYQAQDDKWNAIVDIHTIFKKKKKNDCPLKIYIPNINVFAFFSNMWKLVLNSGL